MDLSIAMGSATLCILCRVAAGVWIVRLEFKTGCFCVLFFVYCFFIIKCLCFNCFSSQCKSILRNCTMIFFSHCICQFWWSAQWCFLSFFFFFLSFLFLFLSFFIGKRTFLLHLYHLTLKEIPVLFFISVLSDILRCIYWPLCYSLLYYSSVHQFLLSVWCFLLRWINNILLDSNVPYFSSISYSV